jgi:hypothetical protein
LAASIGILQIDKTQEKASDWVWIVDQSIQTGIEKCFAILGVRLSCLPAHGQCIRHEDVEPIVLLPVKKSGMGMLFGNALVSANLKKPRQKQECPEKS